MGIIFWLALFFGGMCVGAVGACLLLAIEEVNCHEDDDNY